MRQLHLTIFSRNGNQALIALFVVIFTFLMLFTLRAVEQTPDALDHAFRIKTGYRNFHPHHILYDPTVRLCLRTISSVQETCDDTVFVAQIYGILWAITAVLSFFFIMRQLSFSIPISLLAALSLLVSRGFWVYSTQVEPYIPAVGCLALIVVILIVRDNPQLKAHEGLMISVLLALSILYHRGNVWFCIPLGYYLVATQEKEGRKICLRVIILAGIIVLSAYILAFLSVSKTWDAKEFFLYGSGYTAYHHITKQGSFEHFSVFGLGCMFDSQFRNFVFVPKGLSQTRIVIAAIFAVAMFLLCTFNVLQVIRHSTHAKIRTFLLIWVLTYLLFFLYAIPTMYKFFVFTVFPILLLIFLSLKDMADRLTDSRLSPKILTVAITLFVGFLTTFNLTKEILPFHTSRGPAYLEADKLNSLTPPGYVICTDFEVFQNLRYYFNREKPDVIEVQLPLLYFYNHLPLLEAYRFKKGKGIVIPLAFVVPEYMPSTIYDFNGYKDPLKWLEYVEWLFDFEYDSMHKLIACREFKVTTVNGKDSYILLSAPRIKVDGLKGLFQMLDNQIGEHAGEKKTPFQAWLSTAYKAN